MIQRFESAYPGSMARQHDGDYVLYSEHEMEITRLRKELQAEKLIWAVKEGQTRDNFTRCKSAAEHWKAKAEDGQCCGNCKFGIVVCGFDYSTFRVCDRWETDGLSKEDRRVR